MQTDIANLRDKVSTYYSQYGEIPIKEKYDITNKTIVTSTAIGKNDDIDEFYILDLSSIENLTLNYGRDFENKNIDIQNMEDIYVINKVSHNIFYIQGITLDEETFYTDYTIGDIEKIEKQQTDEDASNWSKQYDKTAIYKDINGDIAYIPKDFFVSRKQNENTILDGLVVKDNNGNEFVWIPVKKEKFNTVFKRTKGYIQEGLQDTVEVNGVSLTLEEIDESNNNMYNSVKKYGGFYIARYETGKDQTNNIVINKNVQTWNNINFENAKNIAEGMYNQTDSVTSTLCYGVQWDAILNFIDSNYITNEKDGEPNCKEDSYVRSKNSDLDGIDVIKNINNLVAGLSEWTMEEIVRDYHIVRAYNNNTPSSRTAINADSVNTNIGFRIALYVNE